VKLLKFQRHEREFAEMSAGLDRKLEEEFGF